MRCGSRLKSILLLLVLVLWVQGCLQPAYSQEAVPNEEVLLNELEIIIDRQSTRILQLESSLEEREMRIQRLLKLLTQNKQELNEIDRLLTMQKKILDMQKPLFKDYERLARNASIEVGVLSGLGGVVLGFVGGVVGMYYMAR